MQKIGPFSIAPTRKFDSHQAGTTFHDLGNAIVGLQFCLRQLNGRQRTDELERVVQSALATCEQGIAAFRRVHEAVSVRKMVSPSDELPEQARRHQMRAKLRGSWAVARKARLAQIVWGYRVFGRLMLKGLESTLNFLPIVAGRYRKFES